MANELRHADVSAGVTSENEFEGIGLHVFNSQATGDILYASSATQLTRLAKGAANTVLVMGATIPAWSATLAGLTLTSPTINGTIATTGLTMPATTLGGTITLNGQTFDAGAGSAQINTTSADIGLIVQSSATTSGSRLILQHLHTTPDVGQLAGALEIKGYDGDTPSLVDYALQRFKYVNVTHTTEEILMDIYLMNAGGLNKALELSGAGVLTVDDSASATYADDDHPVGLFDRYDDAIMLKQGLSAGGREVLADIGVFQRKEGGGYMRDLKAFDNLLAGGVYQNRQKIDDLVDVLVAEFPQVAKKLAERNLIALN